MGIGNHRSSDWLKINAVRLKTAWLHRRTAILSGISVIALAAVFGLVAGNFISLSRLINDTNELATGIEELVEQNKRISQEQHDALFHQIECLAEVSIIAAKGNDVTVTNLEECEYDTTPKAGDQAEVIIVPQIIREFQTETRTETQPAPQEGKKPKKDKQ